MTKPKLTKHEDDIRRGLRLPNSTPPYGKLRKNADISPPQSPHDGIHTCSKGCSKCSRGLRDTIEEQDNQIEALKRDVLEKTAELRNLKEVVHELRSVAEDNKTECESTRIENARLKDEVERLKNTDPDSITGSTIIDDPAWSIACFRFHRENERAEIKRLLKAGDNLERVLTTKVASYEVANASHEWRAAKEGEQQ
jgi:gas vesicle protein